MKNTLINGVKIIDLKQNRDLRGSYTELHRDNWPHLPKLMQWSIVQSRAHAIRGMRIHLIHYDYTCLVHGKATYVLKDLRPGSPTQGQNQYIKLSGKKLQAVVTPPGVAHGFYFAEYCVFAVGITTHYDPTDELGFYFKDPEAGLKWPSAKLVVSPRDKKSPALKEVLPLIPKWHK